LIEFPFLRDRQTAVWKRQFSPQGKNGRHWRPFTRFDSSNRSLDSSTGRLDRHKNRSIGAMAQLTPISRRLLYRRNYANGKTFVDFLSCDLPGRKKSIGSRHVAGESTSCEPQESGSYPDVRIRIAPNTPNSWENSDESDCGERRCRVRTIYWCWTGYEPINSRGGTLWRWSVCKTACEPMWRWIVQRPWRSRLRRRAVRTSSSEAGCKVLCS
jgi:hypothetical protein